MAGGNQRGALLSCLLFASGRTPSAVWSPRRPICLRAICGSASLRYQLVATAIHLAKPRFADSAVACSSAFSAEQLPQVSREARGWRLKSDRSERIGAAGVNQLRLILSFIRVYPWLNWFPAVWSPRRPISQSLGSLRSAVAKKIPFGCGLKI